MTVKLTNQQITQLVKLLLQCPAMQDRSIRNDVLAFLQDPVRGAIPRRDQERADVVSIVKTCNEYPGALEDLLEGMRCYDEGTRPMQHVDSFWQSLAQPKGRHHPETTSTNQSYLGIEDTLYRTDFKRAVETFQRVMGCLDHTGGAMLFLVQNSYPMGGQWLIRRMDSLLKETFYPIHSVSIGFASGMLQSEYGILQRLAEWFPVQSSADELEQHMNDIITQICGLVATRKVIFMELSAWDRLQPQEKMLSWFIHKFWARLVDALHTTIAQNDLRKVHIIAVIVTETELPADVLKPHLCCVDAFVSQKMLALPLENWSLADIQGWLASFSPLMSGHEIDDEARRIYTMSSGGIPRLVGNILLEQFAY